MVVAAAVDVEVVEVDVLDTVVVSVDVTTVVVDDVVKVDVAEIVVSFVASDTVVVVDVLFVFVESSVKKKISIYLTQDRTRSSIIAFKPKALKIIYRHIFLLPLTHHILAL